MIKFAEQIVLNDKFEMILNQDAIDILQDLSNPIEINSTKKQMFDLMYGIAEHLATMQKLSDAAAGTGASSYVSSSLRDNLYVLRKFYELINNIEFKKILSD